MATPAADRIVANRYALKNPLGRGGMGVVWRAQDAVLGREVAVKEVVFPPSLPETERNSAEARVMREARAAARLNHPGAVILYDVVQDEDHPFIVMELVRAPTLAELVRLEGPLPVERVAELGGHVAGALEAAHRAGIVHRDVKPGNVMVPESGPAKLTDFGIASLQGDPQLTATGLVVGSPAYMAPEQAKGEPSGPSTDFWGLGATMYYAVEGVPAFERGTSLATLAAVVNDEPRPMRRAGQLTPMITALLSKDPAVRLTGPELRAELRRFADAAAPSATQVLPIHRDQPPAPTTAPIPPVPVPEPPTPTPPTSQTPPAQQAPKPSVAAGSVAAGAAAEGSGAESPAAVAAPPEASPSTGEAPAVEASATEASTTEPPAVEPPGVEPPAAPDEPVAEAPAAEDPTSAPAATGPPSTESRIPGAPAAEPPAALEELAAEAPQQPAPDGERPRSAPPPVVAPGRHGRERLLGGLAVVLAAILIAWLAASFASREGTNRSTSTTTGGGPGATRQGSGGSSGSTQPPNSAGGQLPAGWTSFTNRADGPYKLGIPPGWNRNTRNGSTTELDEPGDGKRQFTVRSKSVANPLPDASEDYRTYASGAFDDYRELSFDVNGQFAGRPAVVFQFEARIDGDLVHVSHINFKATRAGYNVEIHTPVGQWESSQELIKQFEQAFRPLG
jgi:eukaryotic-like serine/threonine-protein kinase